MESDALQCPYSVKLIGNELNNSIREKDFRIDALEQKMMALQQQ